MSSTVSSSPRQRVHLCVLVNTKTNEVWTSAWSTRGAAIAHLKAKFKLSDECTNENYFEHVPVGWYCSIDGHEIDHEYRDLSEEDVTFGTCGDIGLFCRNPTADAEAREP